MTMEQTVYTCLDPRGEMQNIQLSPLSARADDLDGKTVYFVDNGKNGAEPILKALMELMEKDYPEAKLVYYPKTTAYARPEPQSWWQELEKNAAAAVVAVGD
ncbi:MAG: hypothetical protein GX167_05910 [Firmicutes bacterium]|nr:hypothetical protein [Bacillota bacterium]